MKRYEIPERVVAQIKKELGYTAVWLGDVSMTDHKADVEARDRIKELTQQLYAYECLIKKFPECVKVISSRYTIGVDKRASRDELYLLVPDQLDRLEVFKDFKMPKVENVDDFLYLLNIVCYKLDRLVEYLEEEV